MLEGLGYRVQGIGFRVWGLGVWGFGGLGVWGFGGLGVWGFGGLGVRGSGFGVRGSGFGVRGSGFGVRGLGFGVWGLGSGVWGLGNMLPMPKWDPRREITPAPLAQNAKSAGDSWSLGGINPSRHKLTKQVALDARFDNLGSRDGVASQRCETGVGWRDLERLQQCLCTCLSDLISNLRRGYES